MMRVRSGSDSNLHISPILHRGKLKSAKSLNVWHCRDHIHRETDIWGENNVFDEISV